MTDLYAISLILAVIAGYLTGHFILGPIASYLILRFILKD